MSWMSEAEPDLNFNCPNDVEMVILPRTVDIGNFEVHRALPYKSRRMVGPFIFWDQMGPGNFLTGQGVDVRPHPHIGLSTVTYLFDGSLDHKDSLGNAMRIAPGDVNLMTAGSGIVHSERTGPDVRQNPSRLFGIQSWLAQPKSQEDGLPGFTHVAKADIPEFTGDGITGHLILGDFLGVRSPANTQWDTLYALLSLKHRTVFEIPKETEERALYIVNGTLEICGRDYNERKMIVLQPGQNVTIKAQTDVDIIVLGGAAMDGPRYIWWNYVSSSIERIKAAAEQWKAGGFDIVPGDDKEFIPLPELPFPKK
jgi:redox-sensitive bicupin YhaK (pirin superfamily)